jgi:hypothetical protein
MVEFAEMVAHYEQTYSAFVLASQKIKVEDRLKGGVCGFWSPKQVVDHLTGWLREALKNFEKIQAGEIVDLEYDDDTFNAHAVADRTQLTWNESLADLEDARMKMIHFVTQLTVEDLSKSKVYANWIEGMAEDYQLHRDQLLQWI